MSQSTTSPPVPRPPPTYPHDKGRLRIILAYWAVVLVCLPVWWMLTTVQRLPLPAAKVKDAGSQELHIPINVNINVLDGLCDTATFASSVRMGWDRTHSAEKGDIWDALDVQIGAIGSRRDTSTATYHVILRQGYEEDPPVVQTRSLEVYSRSGCEREYCRIQRGNYLTQLRVEHLVDKVVTLLRDLLTPPIQSTELRVAQYAPRYRVAFSLLNEDASYGGAVNGWLIEQAIEDYLQPTMDELGVLHNFTLESQVQFYAPLTTEPAAVQDGYALDQDQLKIFVNSAEWTLCQYSLKCFQRSGATLCIIRSFVREKTSIYSGCTWQVHISDLISKTVHLHKLLGVISQFNSFLVPQWGGIAILNPLAHGTANKILTPQDLKPIFHLFKKQLEGLLGIPALPAAVAADLDPSTKRILTDWQLDTLLRRRTLENIRGSVQALTSIVGLVGQIENMPVGQTVRSDVLSALDELAQAHNTSQPVWTLTHSARSLLLASKAFFNPDMVGLLYFPAEHKYAVYTPLFAPIAVPLVVSVLRELKARRKASAATGGTKSKIE
ncbi:GPI transamidase component [Ceratobasidium sp. 428]|nr:GPI transamidase component [Ceratobasidium sp. 428]